MKLFAPKYYNEFTCIADKCKHTCCVGWEIDIDSATLKKYKSLSHNYSEKLISSISEEETPHFNLTCGNRCSHLNENGLCEIILNIGEDYLCDICREHPRFYNLVDDHMEVGLGMACEEAARLILSSDDYKELVEVTETKDKADYDSLDVIHLRDGIYSILFDNSLSYDLKLESIYNEFNVSPRVLSDSGWSELISSLEYLDESHKSLFLCYSSDVAIPPEYEKILERALTYFVFRHCSDVEDEYDFSETLGFCLFCERLLASMLDSQRPNEVHEIVRLARILSEELEYSEENTETVKFHFL